MDEISSKSSGWCPYKKRKGHIDTENKAMRRESKKLRLCYHKPRNV